MPRITAKTATPSPPPKKGQITTKSNALHSIVYDGPLSLWEYFAQRVEDDDKARVWLKPSIRLEEQNDAFREERFVGGLDISFGDSSAVTGIYRRTPDVVLMNGQQAGQPIIKAVGELKSPWVKQHELSDNPTENPSKKIEFQHQIGDESGVQSRFISIAFEFESQINAWLANLPPAMRFYEADSGFAGSRQGNTADLGESISLELSWAVTGH